MTSFSGLKKYIYFLHYRPSSPILRLCCCCCCSLPPPASSHPLLTCSTAPLPPQANTTTSGEGLSPPSQGCPTAPFIKATPSLPACVHQSGPRAWGEEIFFLLSLATSFASFSLRAAAHPHCLLCHSSHPGPCEKAAMPPAFTLAGRRPSPLPTAPTPLMKAGGRPPKVGGRTISTGEVGEVVRRGTPAEPCGGIPPG